MANNLRYLLEHFCLDGQTIDISSQLDEENADKIEKLNNETLPNINVRIDNIKNTDIPNLTQRVSDNETNIEGLTNNVNDLANNVIPPIKADISALSRNVESNTTAISTINDTSIPNLQNQIDKLSCVSKWVESPQITTTNSDGLIFKITHFTNGNLHFIDVICDFSNIENPKLNTIYLLQTTDIPLSKNEVYFVASARFIYKNVGTLSIVSDTSKTTLSLTLEKQPNFTSLLDTVRSSLFYFD